MKRMPPLSHLSHRLSVRLAVFTFVVAVIGLSLAPAPSFAKLQPTGATRLSAIQQPGTQNSTSEEDEPCEVATVRHAPQVSGTVIGSIRLLSPESVSIPGSGIITGDLLIPGSPSVRLNGTPTYGGTLDGSGSATPSNHRVVLNGNATLRHVVRQTDAIAMPTVDAPTAPTGVLDLKFTTPTETVGTWSDVRNLTLSGQADVREVPPGSYGTFKANAGTGFILGVEGDDEPSVYSFQSLVLSGQSSLQVVGPVIVTLGSGLTLNASAGNTENAEWLTLNVYAGGVTLHGGSTLTAIVNAPNGRVTVNGNSQFCGQVTSDELRVLGTGVLTCCVAPEPPDDDPEDPPGPTEIFPYGSPWKYMVFTDKELVPADWYTIAFDDSLWPVANGAFASGGYCAIQSTAQTFWPINSDIVVRRTFELPNGVISLRIAGTVDNDVQIYLNETLITDWVVHDLCAQPDDLSFTAPVGSYHVGTNLLTIRARDRGDQSFLDYRVTIND